MEHGVPALWRNIHNLKRLEIRTFHLTWMSFFVCVVAWMGLMPINGVIQEELSLTDSQMSSVIIATVVLAIFARPFAGWCCDMFGPRKTYAWTLFIGAIPVIFSGFAWNFETLIVSRALVGCIGGSFVISIYHATLMFGPNIVGQANGLVTGWGAFGVASSFLVLPAAVTGFFASELLGMSDWRLLMVMTGVVMVFFGVLYLKGTKDTPIGNFEDLRQDDFVPQKSEVNPCWRMAVADHRTWIMSAIYGTCVGLEIAVASFGGLYFIEEFGLSLVQAGWIIGAFGFMNLIGRGFGGFLADHRGSSVGLRGRSKILFACLLLEGGTLMLFSQAATLLPAIILFLLFSLFTQMSEGATYAITPFMKQGSMGAVNGIVAGGGTLGALLAGVTLVGIPSWSEAYFGLGFVAALGSVLVFFMRFSPEEENAERKAIALSSFEFVKQKIEKLRANRLHWNRMKLRHQGAIWRLIDIKCKSLQNQIDRLEDILEEGEAHHHEASSPPQRRVTPVPLRIVWDATKGN